MGVNFPDQVDLRHLVIMVLQLRDADMLQDMTPVLPVPHLEMAKTTRHMQQYPERPPQILDGPVGLNLLLETEFH